MDIPINWDDPISEHNCHFAGVVDGRWKTPVPYTGYMWLMPKLKAGFMKQLGPLFSQTQWDNVGFGMAYNYGDAIDSERFA